MLIIAGHVQVAPERRDALVATFADLVRRAREAPGCLDAAVTADTVDPRSRRSEPETPNPFPTDDR